MNEIVCDFCDEPSAIAVELFQRVSGEDPDGEIAPVSIYEERTKYWVRLCREHERLREHFPSKREPANKRVVTAAAMRALR